MSTSGKREYVLGTGLDELDRLGLQHRLWSEVAHAVWRRAGVSLGARVLDIGCGPGYASFDLAQLVGPAGRVVGVDESEAFITWMDGQAKARGLGQLEARVCDVQKLAELPGLAAGSFDVAYARWVLCFVRDPGAVIAQAAGLLGTGGRLVVHDYFNYATMTMAPRRASHDRVVAATAASWRANGGDPDVAGRVPRLMREAGLRVESVDVFARAARGSDPLFAWPDTWWRTFTPRLVAMGYITEAERQELLADLDELAKSETDFVFTPPVHEIVGVKG